jgi:hypothetical protein
MRLVGVEAEEGAIVVDQVLREDARDQRLADPAFFAADEVDVGHGYSLKAVIDRYGIQRLGSVIPGSDPESSQI